MDVPARPGAGETGRTPLEAGDGGSAGLLIRPFWVMAAAWAALCGALASGSFRWEGNSALRLGEAVLLAALGWGGLWNGAATADWRCRPGPFADSARVFPRLPFTSPNSPAGRLERGVRRLCGSARPSAAAELAGFLLLALLSAVLTWHLPSRVWLLDAALAGLLAGGAVLRSRGGIWLAGQALVAVGLPWLAGSLSFGEPGWASGGLAMGFSLAAWGVLRAAEGRRGGQGLLDGGLIASSALLVYWKEPLAGALIALSLLGVVALQIPHSLEPERRPVARRSWPWLLAAMLVAGWALA